MAFCITKYPIMKYTFLMPAFKVTFIREAIDSILKQSYKDFRLIISDDHSPDNIKKIVDEFDDDRITYRRNEQNIGVDRLTEHWNMLLELANSEYIILSPDDDIYAPDFLKNIDILTQKYPELDIFKSRSQWVNSNKEICKTDIIYEERISMLQNIYNQISLGAFMGIGCFVFKTQALRDLGGFVYFPMAWGSDVMSNVLLSKNGMGVTKDVLFSFRQSDENITSRKGSKRELLTKSRCDLKVREDILALLSDYKPQNSEEAFLLESIRAKIMQERVGHFCASAPTFTFKEAVKILSNGTLKTTRSKLSFIKSLIFTFASF